MECNDLTRRSGTIEDTLIDGTYVAFSDKGFSRATEQSLLTIKNSLVRLQVYEQSYNNSGPGHAGFGSGTAAANLALHGNIFAVAEWKLRNNR
ncbi:MAG TPA: hypothetical protein VJ124_20835 [Pyrinomonadaceae bacterium]|nr:hypothetical protein [Pyrinomonadaceae bacterium]